MDKASKTVRVPCSLEPYIATHAFATWLSAPLPQQDDKKWRSTLKSGTLTRNPETKKYSITWDSSVGNPRISLALGVITLAHF
jgi:hypothetical protein